MSKRTIVITGGAGILGQAAARRALTDGYQVVLIDRASIGDKAGLAGDVRLGDVDLTDAASASAAMADAADQCGGIDALLNIAGGFAWETLQDGDVESWERMFAINLRTAVVASKAALPWLTKSQSGRIVSIGAAGAVKSDMGMGAYAASKAGVARLTESLSRELLGKVTVNAVLPSIIDTPANRADMPDADPSDWVAPDDLAAVILFLASEQARAVTGALLPVTGRV
ncbi:SDR family NAD(P)-dependent oxidoreductase [Maricaulis maris]|uniref:Short-subunit dehydrogenase n=1 Tax=Maricaulis maris TaxID=74318 RepID=A0A495D520_9PROT|nr:SDR family NAD(P)-dependent oxidoreductase [Maricaulis maris]RKQ96519.1 short-subunit dehydrogenase [Maricaulis maris]